jgi:hypothetical protein
MTTRIYCAGAYSAPNVIEVFANMKRGMQLAVRVLQAGMAPFCPWLDYQFSLMSEKPVTLEHYYNYSMSWLLVSDAVIVVPENAETSKGTQAEIKKAQELGIPVFYEFEELLKWKEARESSFNNKA